MEGRGERMKRYTWISLIIMLFSFLLLPISGETQGKKGTEKSQEKGHAVDQQFGFTASREPIHITSDTVEANQKQNRVTFKGNVVAKQGDSTLYANTLVIYYDPNTQKLKEMVATGNVKLVHLNRRATGQRAMFYQDSNKVVLDGEAVVREGENVIRGERLIFYVDEERTVMEGKKGGQISTTIIPPPKEQGVRGKE